MNILENTNTPFLGDIVHAARTLDNDPENHKKKALLAGATTLGLGAYGLAQRSKSFPIAKGKGSILQALTAFAFPAGIYYAVKNRDSKKDVALGIGTSAGSLAVRHKMGLHQMPSGGNTGTRVIKAALPLAGALAAGTYMANELGEARNIENGESHNISTQYPILNTIPQLRKIQTAKEYIRTRL